MKDSAEIIFNNVRFCYGEVCAVNGATFSLLEKKMTVLIGPNGGGKSTLIKLIAGLLRPEEGSIVFHKGLEVEYMPQDFLFDMSFPLTVGELVLQGTLSKKVRPFSRYSHRQKKKAQEAILLLGLNGFEHRSISQLSGGQLKRAAIARAFASEANVIVLDEPDASLDVEVARELYEILNSLKAEKTIVMSSHNIDETLHIADVAIYVNKIVSEYASPSMLKDALKGGVSL